TAIIARTIMEKRKKNKNERKDRASSKNSESQTEHGPKNERMNKVSSKNSESQTEHGPKNERMNKVSSKNSESQTEHGPKNESMDRVSSKNSESQTEHGPKNERMDKVSSKNSESQTEHGPKNERKDRASRKNSESQTEHGPKNERMDRVSSKNSESQTEHGQIVPTKGITKTDQALPHLLILSLADYFVGTDLRNAEQYPIMLAANGFINTGFDVTDKTTCFYCMQSYENWRYTDDIKSIHLRISPTCPMAIGLKCVNVPISTQKMITFHSAVSTNHEDLPMESRSIESLTLNSQIPEVGENFNRSHEASSSVQDTNQAGGFQVSDQFAEGSETALPVCFYCNVPDSSTDNGQDIMVKHIINSPSCGYVKLQMGHNYVETVLELATQQSQITEQMIRDRMNLPIAVGDRMNLPGDARDRMNLPRDVRDRMNLLNYAVRDRMNLPRDVRDRINLPRAIGGRYLQPGLTRAQVPHS
ncbi:E3 ubiquitin-protein ligase XIAP isoform X2, partial [Biomphalaria glabrata]